VLSSPLLSNVEQLQVLCFAYEVIQKFNKDVVEISKREINLPDGEGVYTIPVDLRVLQSLTDQIFHEYQGSYLPKELNALELMIYSNIAELITPTVLHQIKAHSNGKDDHHKEKIEKLDSNTLMNMLLNEVLQLEVGFISLFVNISCLMTYTRSM
jgi:hypothetical protein